MVAAGRARQRRTLAGPSRQGIVIVSNRGPNDFVWQEGRWVVRSASGGLVSLLTPLASQRDVAWYCCVSEPPAAAQKRRYLFTTAADQTDPRLHIVPVPLPADVYRAYYGEISNEVLWMLQHLVLGPAGYYHVDAARHAAWASYLEANRRLASAIVAGSRVPPRAFLVQDYHLYPLPALLRQAFPRTPILHFTHIPFPEPSVLKLLPGTWREALLRGLLGADVVGLQTHADVRAFLACCEEILGCQVDRAAAVVSADAGRLVAVRAYPASVDPRALRRAMRSPAVAEARTRLQPHLGQRNVIRVDRVDPGKNQLAGFLAFGRLLDLRPDLRGRVRFLAFLVPSRTDLGAYRAYRDAIYARVRDLNDRFTATCGGVPPVQVFYTNDRDQALAAMEACDVLLVNSLRDGMNLVAKEWAVVSRRPGVAVVSDTAGVAEEMERCALPVSPLDVEGTARALAHALDMQRPERAARLAELRARIDRWTGDHWLSAQLRDLGLEAHPS